MEIKSRVMRESEKVRKGAVLAKMYLDSWQEYDVTVMGSYATGNIGDLAIGQALQKSLHTEGYKTGIFSRKIEPKKPSPRILGGGGQIHDMSEEKLKNDLGLLNEQSMIIGVGVEEIFNEDLHSWVREKLNQLALITVRDARSKRILKQYTETEVIATSCPAFLHEEPSNNYDGSNAYTGISFKPLGSTSEIDEESEESAVKRSNYDPSIPLETALDRYHQSIRDIVSSVESPKMIPFHHFDREFSRKFNELECFPYNYDVEETLIRVANSKQMVCTRYHSLVFSILFNKPAIAISYAPKVAQLAERAGIPCYMPYESIDLNFTKPTGRKKIVDDAQRNIDLIVENI